MSMLRMVNALRNKMGRTLNRLSSPNEEIFHGINKSLNNLFLVSHRWDYGSRFNGDGFEYRRFVPGLKKVANNICFVPIEAKSQILKVIRNFEKDPNRKIVFSVFQSLSEIPHNYFDLAKEGFYLINWYTDDDMLFDVFSKYVANRFNLNVTTFDPGLDKYQSIGANVFASQWAGIEGYPFLDNRRYIACFIGRMYGERTKLIKRLRVEFGDLVFVHDTLFKHISEDDMVSAYQNSWLAIDEPTAYDGKSLQIKARVFENSSTGCLVLTKPNSRILKYFDLNREILFWKDIPELIDIIKSFQKNPEPYKDMARLVYERTHREHLYQHRFKNILEFIQQN